MMRVLITGANRGLGKEIARQLIDRQAPQLSLYATARHQNELYFLKQPELQVEFFELDLETNSDDFLKQIATLPSFDHIFHIASPYHKLKLLEAKTSDLQRSYVCQVNETQLLIQLAKKLTQGGSLVAAGAIVSAVTGPLNIVSNNPWYAGLFSLYKSNLRSLMASLHQEMPHHRIIHANLGTFCDEAENNNEYLNKGYALTTQQVAKRLLDVTLNNTPLLGFNLDVMSQHELVQLNTFSLPLAEKKSFTQVATSSNLFSTESFDPLVVTDPSKEKLKY